MSLLTTFLPCLSARKRAAFTTLTNTYPPEKLSISTEDPTGEAETASHLLDILLAAEKPNKALASRLRTELESGEVHAQGWYDAVVARVLAGLEDIVRQGKVIGGAVGEAIQKATTWADEFVHEHPVYMAVIVTIVALGALYIVAPWMLSVLGFAELGPVEGSWAAWFQATYGAEVPAGSLFSWLQRLGMTMGKV